MKQNEAQIAKLASFDIETCPTSVQCTFYYNVGRSKLHAEVFDEAQSKLEKSLKLCPWNCHRNRRIVLVYLITARLLRGSKPTEVLLHRYKLVDQFGSLCQALSKGDLRTYKSTMKKHAAWFCKYGIYPLLDRCGETLCYRNLFRRVSFTQNSLIMYHQPRQDRLLLYIKHLMAAAQFVSDDTEDVGDLEGVLVSLISQGYIKGYLNTANKVVVLSKMDPFPPIISL